MLEHPIAVLAERDRVGEASADRVDDGRLEQECSVLLRLAGHHLAHEVVGEGSVVRAERRDQVAGALPPVQGQGRQADARRPALRLGAQADELFVGQGDVEVRQELLLVGFEVTHS